MYMHGACMVQAIAVTSVALMWYNGMVDSSFVEC